MKNIENILLVDDDEIANYIHKIIIEGLNISEKVHMANNGEEALLFIQENCTNEKVPAESCPALIFLDINMPVMDGFEFLDSLENCKDIDLEKISIIVVTSSASKIDIEKANNFNISGYVNKPLTEEIVRNVVTSLS